MKKLFHLAAVIFLSAVCARAFECTDNEMLVRTNKKLKELSEITIQITDRQKVLENLKSREIRSVWNVVSRNSRENSLQRRNRLSLEIAALQEKSGLIKDEIMSAAGEIRKIAADCASDSDFGSLYVQVVTIKSAGLFSGQLLTADEIDSAGQSPQALELLSYRLDIQSEQHSEVKGLIEELKGAKTAFMKADRAAPAAALEALIGELEKLSQSIKDSNMLIRKILNKKVN
jgi:hypothetical protein